MQTDDVGTGTIGRRWVLALVVSGAVVLGAAGCGSSDEPTAATTTGVTSRSTTDGTDAPGTTKPKTSGTTTPGNPPGTNRTTGTAPGGTTYGVPNATIEADEVAEDVTWVLNAEAYQGRDGLLVAYDCAPDGVAATVWGDGVYTDDSSVCSAAVHAGLIDTAGGGRVVIEISEGLDSYDSSTANGITTMAYASWPGSFSFPGI
jgi:hypothetical protein